MEEMKIPKFENESDEADWLYKNREGLAAAFLQATAEGAGRVLITRNTRDFPAGTPGVRIPYTL